MYADKPPHILDLGANKVCSQFHAPKTLTLENQALVAAIRGWVGPRANLNMVQRENSSICIKI
jgi:hypothetical protein